MRQLLTDYKVFPSEWDESRSMVTTTQKSERKSFILSIRERIRWDVERLTKIDRKLNSNGLTYTADDVIDEFNRYAHEYSLFNFMENIIARLKQNSKVRTSETYKSTLNSFKKFRKDEDIMLDCLTSEIMEAYEAWHKGRELRLILYHSTPVFCVPSITVQLKMTLSRTAIRSVMSIPE